MDADGPCTLLIWVALTNIPYFILQEKYAVPSTEPSFLPFFSYSSMPIHLPEVLNDVGPLKRTTPRPGGMVTMEPKGGSIMVAMEGLEQHAERRHFRAAA